MSDHDENLLLNVAMTVADGLPVDWDALCATYPELVDEFEKLRLLEGVSQSLKQEPESENR